MAEDKTTILEGIISDVAVALYQRWANELPEEARTKSPMLPLQRMLQEPHSLLSRCLWISLTKKHQD